jgi:ergothioneine biosynthesis protein EgtB
LSAGSIETKVTNRRKLALRVAMQHTRERTLRLLEQTPERFFNTRVHDFYSPIGWHFGHIGMTEEAWTLCKALGKSPLDGALSFLFANIPENPKDDRVHLPRRAEIIAYLESTRSAALNALDNTDIDCSTDPLIRDGYAWEFALQHECQHQETIAELLQLIRQCEGAPADFVAPQPFEPPADTQMMPVSGGKFRMGSNARGNYDNERCEHDVLVAPFSLDRLPVTASQWLQFVKQRGYRRKELWSAEGWDWRERHSVELPEYWVISGDGYAQFSGTGLRAIHPNEPVSSISWFEADAYARWIGKRLPTEAEWEFAAAYDPLNCISRRYPWGASAPTSDFACFGLEGWHSKPAGERGKGNSAYGLMDMAGNVWEWTSSPFLPYPGFEAFPYDGYSKDHMDGKHYVCRGGSFATAAPILRCTFRNWYVPTYRQGFLGVRCAL